MCTWIENYELWSALKALLSKASISSCCRAVLPNLAQLWPVIKFQRNSMCSHAIFIVFFKFQMENGGGDDLMNFSWISHHFDVQFVCLVESNHICHKKTISGSKEATCTVHPSFLLSLALLKVFTWSFSIQKFGQGRKVNIGKSCFHYRVWVCRVWLRLQSLEIFDSRTIKIWLCLILNENITWFIEIEVIIDWITRLCVFHFTIKLSYEQIYNH